MCSGDGDFPPFSGLTYMWLQTQPSMSFDNRLLIKPLNTSFWNNIHPTKSTSLKKCDHALHPEFGQSLFHLVSMQHVTVFNASPGHLRSCPLKHQAPAHQCPSGEGICRCNPVLPLYGCTLTLSHGRVMGREYHTAKNAHHVTKIKPFPTKED